MSPKPKHNNCTVIEDSHTFPNSTEKPEETRDRRFEEVSEISSDSHEGLIDDLSSLFDKEGNLIQDNEMMKKRRWLRRREKKKNKPH